MRLLEIKYKTKAGMMRKVLEQKARKRRESAIKSDNHRVVTRLPNFVRIRGNSKKLMMVRIEEKTYKILMKYGLA